VVPFVLYIISILVFIAEVESPYITQIRFVPKGSINEKIRRWIKEWHKRRRQHTRENLTDFMLSDPYNETCFFWCDSTVHYLWDPQDCYPWSRQRNTNMIEAVTHRQRSSITLRYLTTGNNI
jgi:hypothetical protein